MRFFYTLAAYIMLPVICAVMLWRAARGDTSYLRHFTERFGLGPEAGKPGVWVHAVSFGEVQASAALVRALRQRYPDLSLTVTTVTPTGADRARSLFAREAVHVRYIPYDLPGCVRRFFDRLKPRLAIIFETELWPNLYHECGRRRVPLVLASARISPRSLTRYRWLGGLFRDALSHGAIIAAQGEADAERFKTLGADPSRTHVIGNIKFDFPVPPETLLKGREIRSRQAAGRPMWVAGSTHAGEEEAMLEAHERVRTSHPDALLALVPRHPPRFDEVAALLERQGVRFVRHSRGEICRPETQVLLVDTLGELLEFYAASDVAFVAGSFAPIGGHNLVEPAGLALPILTGPHNFNSEDIARLLTALGAVQIVRNPQQLGDRLAQLLADPAARARIGAIGRAAVDANRGALQKLLNLIDPLLR